MNYKKKAAFDVVCSPRVFAGLSRMTYASTLSRDHVDEGGLFFFDDPYSTEVEEVPSAIFR